MQTTFPDKSSGLIIELSPSRFITQFVPSAIGTVKAYVFALFGRMLTLVATKSNLPARTPGRIPCQGRSN